VIAFRLATRRVLRSAALWGVVFSFYVAATAIGYADAYPTVAQRQTIASTFGSNAGLVALIGQTRDLVSVAGFTAWRSLGVLALVGSIWGFLTSTRLLRGDEEAGRWEMLLAGRTTRRGATAAVLAGLGLGVTVLWSITAVVTVLVGRSAKVDFDVTDGLYLALSLICGAALFLAIGAFTSQLAVSRRRASGYAAIMLGVCFALRMVADSAPGVHWMNWVTPLGWIEHLQPMNDPQPLALLPIVALLAACVIGTLYLAGVRDLQSGALRESQSAEPRLRLLGGPTGLTLRLVRPTIVGWLIGICGGALMMGSLSKAAGDAVQSSSGFENVLNKLGARGFGAQTFLSVAFLIVGLLVGLLAAGQVAAIRAEEEQGHLDHLFARRVSRVRWLSGRIGVAAVAICVAGVLAGVVCFVGAASQDAGVGFKQLLYAGLDVVPSALLIFAVGVLVFAVLPRAAVAASYGFLVWSFLVLLVGGIAGASHWLLDTSLLTHLSGAPSKTPDWSTFATITAIAVAVAAAGLFAFTRRDVTSD
jgi:ABC-2 type transport system permease protein